MPAYNPYAPYPAYSSNISGFYNTINTASTIWPQPYAASYAAEFRPESEWEQAKAKADIKAQPDDEFSWLRRRVSEVEDRAFA